MTTNFTALPIIDLAPLCSPEPAEKDIESLSCQLNQVFETVGFAYLINAPISYSLNDICRAAHDFFSIDDEQKMKLAKRSFRSGNINTYRGFFPAQKGSDNLKEGFEVGPPHTRAPLDNATFGMPLTLTEANVWPSESVFASRAMTEHLYSELQSLACRLLSLLAASLGKDQRYVTSLLTDSISTLRYLHYPAIVPPATHQEFNCTPHTDSGLLTLLHQDATGGLEVRNAAGEWIPAPHVPGSIVVNIGDLMAQMSAGRYVATCHRVRNPGVARYSVPFFCEPGVNAMVGESGKEIPYQQFVLSKMDTWIEFQDVQKEEHLVAAAAQTVAVGA